MVEKPIVAKLPKLHAFRVRVRSNLGRPCVESETAYTLKLSPQPQLAFTFGLLNLKAAFRPSRA